MSAQYSAVVETARDYYNSGDADNFYYHVWGGEDIHIGLYEHDTESITVASKRTVATMAEQLKMLNKDARVADLGAGYGGAARWLASGMGCHVACVNLSEAQNTRNRAMNRELGLANLIEVHDASFEDVPYPDETFDIVWSQDSFLHSGDRERVFNEVDRILKPGGEFVFTDPMQAENCPEGVLQPVLDRLHLDSLGSVKFYRAQAERLGWKDAKWLDLSQQLVRHYTRVRQELARRREELEEVVTSEYIDRTIQGLGKWMDAGDSGYLAWGVLLFRKPE